MDKSKANGSCMTSLSDDDDGFQSINGYFCLMTECNGRDKGDSNTSLSRVERVNKIEYDIEEDPFEIAERCNSQLTNRLHN